jgi:peptidoglycan hydrolase-like protein with peptidoglycan-binding domain
LLLFQSAHDLNESGFVDQQSEALLNKIVAAQETTTTSAGTTPVTTTTPAPTTITPVTTTTPAPLPTGLLTRNLGPGSTGADVIILQHLLAQDGDYSSSIFSAYYGNLTETAVKIFQGKYGIINYGFPTTTGYGVVGTKTRAKLNEL